MVMRMPLWKVMLPVAVLVLAPLCAACYQNEVEDEPLIYSDYRIALRPNYQGGRWVFEEGTDRLIGYAMWDNIKHRFTVFDLDGKYHGFYQGTVDSFYPGYYVQYLRYAHNDKYSHGITVLPGGRPKTATNPYGELGGQWVVNEQGNIPIPDPMPDPGRSPLDKIDDLLYNY